MTFHKVSRIIFYLIALQPLLFLGMAYFVTARVPAEILTSYSRSLRALLFFIASILDAAFVLFLARVFYRKNVASAEEYEHIPNRAFLLISLNTLVICLGMIAFFLSINWIYLIASIAMFYWVYFIIFRKLREFEENYAGFRHEEKPLVREERKIQLNINRK